jgi:hypothetical protein
MSPIEVSENPRRANSFLLASMIFVLALGSGRLGWLTRIPPIPHPQHAAFRSVRLSKHGDVFITVCFEFSHRNWLTSQ